MNRNRKINSNDDGDDGQSKRERQKRKLVEGEGLDLKRTTCYRSNLHTTIKELNDLESIYKCDAHKLMKKTEKHEENLREIMLAFDHNIDKFVVGRETISLTSRDVQLIFGMGSGPKYIPLRDSRYEVVPWVRRCFRNDIERAKGNFVLYKTIIYQRLQTVLEMHDEISCVDADRLTHIYLLVVLLAPNQNASIVPHLAGYLENLGTVCNYDWCTYIVDMLVHQIKETKTLRAGECMILLAYWLYEHTSLVTLINEVAFPRFLKWDLNDLQKALSGAKVTELDIHLVRGVRLKATPREQEHFNRLLKFWEDEYNERSQTQSEDDGANTTAMSSRDNDGSFGTTDPMQTQYDTYEYVDATVDIATHTDSSPVKEDDLMTFKVRAHDTSTSLRGSTSHRFEERFGSKTLLQKSRSNVGISESNKIKDDSKNQQKDVLINESGCCCPRREC